MTTPNPKVYNGYLIPDYAEDYMSKYHEFEVRDDDIYIACFNKCGTTWLQKMTYLIMHGYDYEDPYMKRVDQSMPYLELQRVSLDDIQARKGLRILKTHMPYCLLPPDIHKKKAKIITIARNPKDVAVSFYHFARSVKVLDYNGDIRLLIKLFIEGKVVYAPYNKYVEEYWQHRNDENMLFLFYEDMKRDLMGSVKTLAKFLDQELSEDMLQKITSSCQFESMKNDPDFNYDFTKEVGTYKKDGTFMRKGEVGDWKNYLTPEESATIEGQYKYLEDQGLTFTYEL